MERCGHCARSFVDQQALQQHIRASPAHTTSFRCVPCNRSYKSQADLEKHIRASPAHAKSFRCELCNRSYKSQADLEKHIRDSPAHAKSFRCELCNRSYKSQADLESHIRDSPAHAESFYCTLCRRTFKNKDGLDQHIKFSTIHNAPPPVTPLDRFFQSFRGFEYNTKSSPSKIFAQLSKRNGWKRDDENHKSAWKRYQSALQEEVAVWFGSENDLSSWHSLCRAIEIEPLPTTCAQGVKVVRGVYVNIVDLLEWARKGREGLGVRKFSSLKDLRAYTKKTRKIFSGDPSMERGGKNNVVLRHLLRFIFR
ncbi:uncharacterized protein N7515_007423 [Penicillium bovifimosum]|uniref:C2H2-type domain-containing protein n=1 Tax=Penicillium bovifimosum TaxID=126998 RepID=A0A9W9GWL0_9EURO|nr:uncharacterized protein N7515_007423 [Penicillium bovifimosum]KAJ5131384.1 hypothetical protein N7515_007423 [Penicillium bovifimosum]